MNIYQKLEYANSNDKPSAYSISLARSAIDASNSIGLEINKVVTLPGGGVVIYAFNSDRMVGIVADNDHLLLSVFMISVNHDTDEYFDIDNDKIIQACQRIKNFLLQN